MCFSHNNFQNVILLHTLWINNKNIVFTSQNHYDINILHIIIHGATYTYLLQIKWEIF